jgi:hypothetical protein
MGRPVKKKEGDPKDPQINPRYQAMSTWRSKKRRK